MPTIAQQIAQRQLLNHWHHARDAQKNQYWITFFERMKLSIIAAASNASVHNFFESDDLYDNLRYNTDKRIFVNENIVHADIMRDQYMSGPFELFYAWLKSEGCDCKFVVTYDRSLDYIYVNLHVFTI